MTERHHLFVSYAHVDNKPMPGVKNGWVTELVRALTNIVEGELGRPDDFNPWMDHELHGNDAVTPTIERALLNSDTILLVLSPAYLASSWCTKELTGFLERHGIESGRVFMVEFNPVERPEALRDLLGFRFHEVDPEGRITKLGWPQPNPAQMLYYERVDDLGRALAGKIRELNDGDDADPPRTPERTVLLAPVSDDLRKERDALRRALEQERIAVLPENGYYRLDALDDQLKSDLAKADLYVQLISDAVGAGLPAHYHRHAADTSLPRRLWHAPSVELDTVADDDHRALFEDQTLIVSDLTELQGEILKALRPEPVKPPLEGKLFIHHAPEDEHHVGAITRWLADHHLRFNLPMPKATEISVSDRREDITRNLLQCEQLLFLFCEAEEAWLDQQFILYRQIQSRRKDLALFGLCSESAAHAIPIPPEVTIFRCDAHNVTHCLEHFINGGDHG